LSSANAGQQDLELMAPQATDRCGNLAIGLHWLTLAVLIAVYACINLTDLYPKGGEPRDALKTWHFMLGLTILALSALPANRFRSSACSFLHCCPRAKSSPGS